MLLDSNVLVASVSRSHGHHEAVLRFIERAEGPLYVSALSRVEFLGRPGATPGELALREYIYEGHEELPIDGAVLNVAAGFRRRRQGLKTADAIIAGAAFHYRIPLVTANLKDFDWIEELAVIDPTV
ncbi:PIN domain-containing protein [Rubrivirga sp.]|uniref:PIN domain-containing protein n=1 Tax=Rubrivirga sp. TaxID=1885344 RepID=UPI003B519A65